MGGKPPHFWRGKTVKIEKGCQHIMAEITLGIMIGVGAPTSLAIDLANKFDITLVGFVKRDSFNIYTNNKKVIVG